uniref:G_PROTEIN_RECEP_F1_2 domain-containing protein n=1 Tax=Heterorhabditis bacteriophora TaxID=37862 RepID=A0A1I7WZS3_HETBA
MSDTANSIVQLNFRYRVLSKQPYIIVMIIPGVCIGIFFVVVSYALMPPNVIREVCVLPFSMPDKVSTWWNHYNMWTSVVTVLIYCLTYFQLYCFYTKDYSQYINSSSLKPIKIVVLHKIFSCIQILFLFSSLGSATIIMVMRNLNVSREIVVDAETYAGIPGETTLDLIFKVKKKGLLSYSCNFYVYFWRSMDYREAFKRQLICARINIRMSDSHTKSVSY